MRQKAPRNLWKVYKRTNISIEIVLSNVNSINPSAYNTLPHDFFPTSTRPPNTSPVIGQEEGTIVMPSSILQIDK